MNKLGSLFVGILAVMSTDSLAATSDFVKKSGDQFYVGGDIAAANRVDIDIDNLSGDEATDIGFNLIGGYEFNTHPFVKPSLEVEYRTFGDVENTGRVKVDGDAFFINFKTKLFVQYDFGNLYLAPLVGIGQLAIDGKGNGISLSEKETSYQAGLEFGTRLKQGIDLHIGYRTTLTELNKFDSLGNDIDIDISFSGAYVGARYYF